MDMGQLVEDELKQVVEAELEVRPDDFDMVEIEKEPMVLEDEVVDMVEVDVTEMALVMMIKVDEGVVDILVELNNEKCKQVSLHNEKC